MGTMSMRADGCIFNETMTIRVSAALDTEAEEYPFLDMYYNTYYGAYPDNYFEFDLTFDCPYEPVPNAAPSFESYENWVSGE